MHHVLIVDDNDAIRESLADALADEGYAVEGAPDGLSALDIARDRPPHIILLDLMMPGLDGSKVMALLKQNGCLSPVIIVSADRKVDDRARALGAAGFLAKPFDLDALVVLIQTVLGPLPRG